MRRIRSGDTKPELIVRSGLHKRGLRFRVGRSDLPGRPDIVLRKWGAVVFVHGCFWHQHSTCPDGRQPKSNAAYWTSKLAKNRERDLRVRRLLKKQGWRVLRVWECEILNRQRMEQVLDRLAQRIRTVEL